MFYKRSWQTVGSMTLGLGITFMLFGVLLAKPEEMIYCIILFAIGLVSFVIGLYVLIWDRKGRKAETGGKVDKNVNYTFTLSTNRGIEVVTEFVQIERALKELEQTRQGMVEVKIEPPMARICSVDCSYQKGYFYTYYLQERADGKGYWFSVCDETGEARSNLKLLFVKHKKIDFTGVNRKETGAGR